LNGHNQKFAIEERRRQVAACLAKAMTQSEIAKQLGVDQSTVSDDVKALALMSQRFVYDLAKSDLGWYYKECIDGIQQAKRELWRMYRYLDEDMRPDSVKLKLMALKVSIQADVEKFKLLSEGPNILAVKSMEDRLANIEQNIEEKPN
jgi:IS30 family transposase